MSRRPRKVPPVIAIAGEDENDRLCLQILLRQLYPSLTTFVRINTPVRLHGTKGDFDRRAVKLRRLAQAAAAKVGGELACLIACEDLDRAEGPQARETQTRVHKDLQRVAGASHYVLVVAELEAWLLLFPEALNGFRKSWSVPDRRVCVDTGMLADPKRVLMTEVSRGKHRYRETDAPAIVERIVAGGFLNSPNGRNTSWREFTAEIEQCRAEHGTGGDATALLSDSRQMAASSHSSR